MSGIQRQQNGDLTWVQGGQIMTVSKEQPDQYNPALETEDAQNSARQANKEAEDAYMQDLKNAQGLVDASRPIPGIPVKPHYVTVSDPVKDGATVTPGVESIGPWPAPGLPELQHKMIYKSGASKPSQEEFIIEPPHAEHH